MEPKTGTEGGQEPAISREQVRKGLTMVRRRSLKPDGRYLIEYDFIRGETGRPGDAAETA